MRVASLREPQVTVRTIGDRAISPCCCINMATSSDDGEQPLAETLATASRRLGDVTKMMNEYTNHSTKGMG